jgi:hypothetical protein
MKFKITGDIDKAEFVCNEIIKYANSKWKSKFIVKGNVKRQGDALIFEVNTRPEFVLNHAKPAQDTLYILLQGMLMEQAYGATCEVMASE